MSKAKAAKAVAGSADDVVRGVGRFLGRAFGRGGDEAAETAARAAQTGTRFTGKPLNVVDPLGNVTRVPTTSTALELVRPAAAKARAGKAAKQYPIRGSFPVRFFLGKPGRGLGATAKSAAWRIPSTIAGVGALGAISGLIGEDGPSDVDAQIESLRIGTTSPIDLRLNRLGQAYTTAEAQIAAQEQALDNMLRGSEAGQAEYQKLLENYRANTMRDIQGAYGRASEEALRAAREIEGGGAMARQNIVDEGAATAAALQALAEQPAQAGTGMFTGLVPVTGEVAEAPQAAVNAADIAATAAQRGVNITRDDLRAAAAMAPMISEAYGRQVDSQTSMAMALAQIAGNKEREQMAYEETARIGAQRTELALQRAAQEDALLAEALAAVAPDQLQVTLGRYNNLMKDEDGQRALAARGITSFTQYLEATVGRETLDRLREIAGLGTGG